MSGHTGGDARLVTTDIRGTLLLQNLNASLDKLEDLADDAEGVQRHQLRNRVTQFRDFIRALEDEL